LLFDEYEFSLNASANVFRENHWKGVMFDNNNNNPTIGLYQASVWIDNVVPLFQSKNVPMVFDLLSVDTNFNDFWNLRAIMLGGYRPRVVIVEVSLIHLAGTAVHF